MNSEPGMPRWVKGFVVAAAILVVVVVVAHLLGFSPKHG